MKTIERFIKKVVTARPHESLGSIARLMEQHNVGAVIVAENDRPVGIVTDRDLALQVAAHGMSPQTAVAKIMNAPVLTVNLSDGVFDTTELMRERKVRRLPVVDEDGRLAGMVTLDDLLRLLSRELANLTEGIEPETEMTGSK